MKIHTVGTRLFLADTQTGTKKMIVTFDNLSNAPNNYTQHVNISCGQNVKFLECKTLTVHAAITCVVRHYCEHR